MRQRMTKAEYADYLKSDHWLATRKAAKKRAGHRCERCLTRHRPLHVHHLSYDHLGDERGDELQCLCDECHRQQHVSDKHLTWEEVEQALRDWMAR